MRPVALPAAGGLLSTIFLFAMIAPMYSVSAETIVQDVPTELTTQAALSHYRASFSTLREDIVVDVMIDGNGRMVDYSVPAGQVWQHDPALRRCIENILICMVFTPATWFGKPASGTIRITVSSNQVDVQG